MEKKRAALLLAAMAVAAVLAGCGEKQETMGGAERNRQEQSGEGRENADKANTPDPKGTQQPEATGTSKQGERQETVTLVLGEEEYISREDIWIRRDRQYDEFGRLTCEETIERDNRGRVQSKVADEYQYDESGRLILKNRVNYGSFLDDSALLLTEFGYEYEYDESGRLIKETETGYMGESFYSQIVTVYEYDGLGNKVREEKFSYDEEGRLINRIGRTEYMSITLK